MTGAENHRSNAGYLAFDLFLLILSSSTPAVLPLFATCSRRAQDCQKPVPRAGVVREPARYRAYPPTQPTRRSRLPLAIQIGFPPTSSLADRICSSRSRATGLILQGEMQSSLLLGSSLALAA